jgi:hypothetical protein
VTRTEIKIARNYTSVSKVRHHGAVLDLAYRQQITFRTRIENERGPCPDDSLCDLEMSGRQVNLLYV